MSNKPNAIVFFDLDGTLLNSNVDVCQSSIDAIKQLIDNNITPILATGRTVCEVRHIMDKTAIESIVAMNGQFVSYQGEKVFENNIDPQLIDEVFAFSQQQNMPISFYNHEIMRVSEHNSATEDLYHYLSQAVPPVDKQIYKTTFIQMILLLCRQGEEAYVDRFPSLNFIRNTPYCVDVFNRGGSKAFGIEKLIENKGFSDVPTYAFGDGDNDIEMFEWVDHPIAMGNAKEKLKQLATFVTDDNNHHGIANGLKWAGLI